jgi:hypothetical protein
MISAQRNRIIPPQESLPQPASDDPHDFSEFFEIRLYFREWIPVKNFKFS